MNKLFDFMKKCGVETVVIDGLKKLHSLESKSIDFEDVAEMVEKAHAIWSEHLSFLDNIYLAYDFKSDNVIVRAYEDEENESYETMLSLNEIFSPSKKYGGYEEMKIFYTLYIEALDKLE